MFLRRYPQGSTLRRKLEAARKVTGSTPKRFAGRPLAQGDGARHKTRRPETLDMEIVAAIHRAPILTQCRGYFFISGLEMRCETARGGGSR